MLIPNHPDPERLSALASHDDDATTDAALTSHVSSCARCATLVSELGALRMSLADLPDIAPSRPLLLVPPVADAPASGGAAGWVRRLFAPMLTAGAAIAMVGLVGTTAPILSGASSQIFTNVGSELSGGGEEPASSLSQALSTDDAAAPAAEDGGEAASAPSPGDGDSGTTRDSSEDPHLQSSQQEFVAGAGGGDEAEPNDGLTTLPAERSPWPMVLFAGVTVVIAALLLRWILVPRAG